MMLDEKPNRYYWRETYDGPVLRLNFSRDGVAASVDLNREGAAALMSVILDGLDRKEKQMFDAAPELLTKLKWLVKASSGLPIARRRELSKFLYQTVGEVVNYAPPKKPKRKTRKHRGMPT